MPRSLDNKRISGQDFHIRAPYLGHDIEAISFSETSDETCEPPPPPRQYPQTQTISFSEYQRERWDFEFWTSVTKLGITTDLLTTRGSAVGAGAGYRVDQIPFLLRVSRLAHIK